MWLPTPLEVCNQIEKVGESIHPTDNKRVACAKCGNEINENGHVAMKSGG